MSPPGPGMSGPPGRACLLCVEAQTASSPGCISATCSDFRSEFPRKWRSVRLPFRPACGLGPCSWPAGQRVLWAPRTPPPAGSSRPRPATSISAGRWPLSLRDADPVAAAVPWGLAAGPARGGLGSGAEDVQRGSTAGRASGRRGPPWGSEGACGGSTCLALGPQHPPHPHCPRPHWARPLL